ncbi:HvfC/BufC N-terminal domain-containing protein [Vibrio sp. T11.5]|uniref:HvfC/BufC N-terminal domain-containing protein n=1 Tax=Vibrio sp. T11.5 TaxID=2998836 RepID=UPI0022CD77D0|nr:DNA-binding domain-containing protein [Vibrio sp. T11.5]MDA0116908.1 DNA-binding domain-containing protein [Vibrio sp. T11.5]
MSSTSELAARQQWLLESILQGPKANQMASHYIMGTAELSSSARLAIYQDGYRLRLLECMEAEFPALQHYLGEALFRLFSLGYLQQRPSRHYSLYQLGEDFANFLDATRPRQHSGQPYAVELKIPEQLARLERAQANAIRAPGVQYDQAPDLGGLLQLPALALPDSSELVEHDFALRDYILAADRHTTALEQGLWAEKPTMPTLGAESVLVYRHHFQVKMAQLEPWQADVVRSLGLFGQKETNRSPTPVAWQTLVEHNQLPESELLMKLSLWLPQALKENQLMLVNSL